MRKNFLWPDVSDLDGSKQACYNAAGFAWFMGIATGVIVAMSSAGKLDFLHGLVDKTNYLDTIILILLGLGLFYKSRIAALAALLYVIMNRVLMMQQSGAASGIFATIVQVGVFLGGVRGSFSYHEIVNAERRFEEKGKALAADSGEAQSETKKAGPSGFRRVIPLLAVAIFGAAAIVIMLFVLQGRSGSKPGKEQAVITDFQSSAPAPQVAESSQPSVKSGARSFKLRSGETVSGKVILDDPVYLTLETSGGSEKIVIKEDIAQEIKS